MNRDDTKLSALAEIISAQGIEGLGSAVQILFNEAMLIERDRHLNALAYERTESRTGYANGFKPKVLKMRLGALNLSVPQVRDSDFYPSFLERGVRSERALSVSLAEMYVQGVSTRKVSAIIEELCGFQVSSAEVSRAAKLLDEELAQWRGRPVARSPSGEVAQWRGRPLGLFKYLILDARYEKVRQSGSVVDSAVLVAYGVDAKGLRHVLGVSVSLSEAEVHWRAFLDSLVSRGLHGLLCITSDAHAGLKAAIRAVFPGVPWQRCQFHLQQNAQAYVPKQSMKTEVAEDIRIIFNASNRDEADRLLKLAVIKYEKTAPQLSQWMETNIHEGLNIFNLKSAHRRRLRTSNLAERINREIKRRTRVVGIFPSAASCERLVTALLIETSEEWEMGKVYLSMDD
jgi:putative transposase